MYCKKRYFQIISCLFFLCFFSCKDVEDKKIVCWGDSLTAPSGGRGIRGTLNAIVKGKAYPELLQSLLGDEYSVINAGVGGENTLSIMARQGASPMVLSHDVTLYKTEEIDFEHFIGSRDIPAFKSLYYCGLVTPLLQKGWEESSPAKVNPCYIEGHKCLLKSDSKFWKEEGKYVFEYNYFIECLDVMEKTATLPAGSVIETYAMRELRGVYANIFFMGQNGGFSTVKELIKQYKEMIAYSQCDKYIIISFHKPNLVLPDIQSLMEMEDSLLQSFGNHYINLREYMVKDGLIDAGLKPTQEDEDSILKGQVPPQLLSDNVHFTAKGKELIAKLVNRKIKELGY